MEDFTEEEKKKLEEKDNFVVSKKDYYLFRALDNETIGDIFKALFEYKIYNLEPNYNEKSVEFVIFRQLLNTSLYFDRKYLDTCKRNKENIQKRYNKDDKNDTDSNGEYSEKNLNKLYENKD